MILITLDLDMYNSFKICVKCIYLFYMNIEKINDFFKVPIFYNKEKVELNKNIILDLELTETLDPSGTSIYQYAFQPTTRVGKKVLEQFPLHYTTDVTFLKQTQELLKVYKDKNQENDAKTDEILKIWDDIKNDTGFKERYQYLDWAFLEQLNHSKQFLQLMSLYNLSSPVLSLLIPVFILIIPFFVIQMKGIPLSIGEYIQVIKMLIQGHAVGKLFTQFHTVKWDEKVYILLSASFYFFSIYQNVLTCLKFHENMKKMHNHLKEFEIYLQKTEEKMYTFLSYSSSLSCYEYFNDKIKETICILANIRKEIEIITPYKVSFQKILQFGHVLKCFYEIYSDPIYNEAFLFSFGFNGFLDLFQGYQQNIQDKFIHFSKFEKKEKKENKENKEKTIKSYFENSYYPPLMRSSPQKNTVYLNKNMIITGPNASGKTTILKSSLINILLTQQMGSGFYSKASLLPYHYIHCYLNIPDTSGRDSLFQAEARRCKDILDIIQEKKSKRHFCVFDELYSGTNPDEAIMSANAFMNYLVKNKNVNSMLTTHFIDLCQHLEKKSGSFANYHMHTREKDDGSIEYLYELKDGISHVRGGVQVLKDMKYPEEIILNL